MSEGQRYAIFHKTPQSTLKKDKIAEVFADYNDINEQTGIRLDLIDWSLAQLQVDKKRDDKPSKRIGFVQDDDK